MKVLIMEGPHRGRIFNMTYDTERFIDLPEPGAAIGTTTGRMIRYVLRPIPVTPRWGGYLPKATDPKGKKKFSFQLN